MRSIFVRNAVIAVNAVKINIPPHFNAFLTKIHRKIHRISYKNSPHRHLWQINVRNAVKAVNAVKKFTAFRCISYKNSPRNSPHDKFIAFDFQNLLNLISIHKKFQRCISPHFLRKFNAKPRPGRSFWLTWLTFKIRLACLSACLTDTKSSRGQKKNQEWKTKGSSK